MSWLDGLIAWWGRLWCSHDHAYPTNWRSRTEDVHDTPQAGGLMQIEKALWKCPSCGHRWHERRTKAYKR